MTNALITALFTAIFTASSSQASSAQLVVHQLSNQKYEALPNPAVPTTFALDRWVESVNRNNQEIAQDIHLEKIARIVLETKEDGDTHDIHEDDPWVKSIAKRAARLGSNVIEYEENIKNRNGPHLTFLAYRVTYKNNLFPKHLFASIFSGHMSVEDFEKELNRQSP